MDELPERLGGDRATAGGALPVYVRVNNKAEGCGPLSVPELAQAVTAAPDT